MHMLMRMHVQRPTAPRVIDAVTSGAPHRHLLQDSVVDSLVYHSLESVVTQVRIDRVRVGHRRHQQVVASDLQVSQFTTQLKLRERLNTE